MLQIERLIHMAYMTSQRKALYELLEKHHDESLSSDEIIELMGEKASRSAVYRNLAALKKQGLIKETMTGTSSKTVYRYVGSHECINHLHLECSKCGKTYHLDTPATNTLIKDVMQESNFQVDSSSTVLYGICETCRKRKISL